MTTQYAILNAQTGHTGLQVELFAVNGDTVLYTSDSVTERSNALTQYLATFGETSEIPAGTYFALMSVIATGVVIASGERVFTGTDTEVAATVDASILADTDDLQTNQGDWATATGFSIHDAADVVAALGTGSTLTDLATSAELPTDFDTLVITDGKIGGIAGTINTLDELDTALDTAHGDGSWEDAGGGGGGDATAVNQESILAAIQGTEVIQVASPNVSGNLVLTQGDTYDGVGNPKAQWTVATDYTDGWAVTFTIRDANDAVVYTTSGEVVSATAIAVELTAPTGQTMTGCPGQWQGKFDVQVTKSGSVQTIAIGTVYINEDQTR